MDKPQNALNERQAGGGEERHKAEEGDRCASTVVASKGPKTSSLIAALSFEPVSGGGIVQSHPLQPFFIPLAG